MVYICINQELYLTNSLKANMLMWNNVIGSKRIFINNTKKTTLIASCGVYIKIDAKQKIFQFNKRFYFAVLQHYFLILKL